MGVIYVTCKAGETIVIPDLPAGTTYTVEEVELPAHWELVEIENEEGIIASNGVSLVTATNKYDRHQTIYLDLEAHRPAWR